LDEVVQSGAVDVDSLERSKEGNEKRNEEEHPTTDPGKQPGGKEQLSLGAQREEETWAQR